MKYNSLHRPSPRVELCNMCLVTAPDGRILVQHRLPKPTNPWCGLTLPGGHVEAGENVVESTIREIREETGLEISALTACGYVDWFNPEDESRYFVFLFKTSTFTGTLKGSAEGKMEWMTLDEMLSGKLAPNMREYLRVFLDDGVIEAYGINGGTLSCIGGDGK